MAASFSQRSGRTDPSDSYSKGGGSASSPASESINGEPKTPMSEEVDSSIEYPLPSESSRIPTSASRIETLGYSRQVLSRWEKLFEYIARNACQGVAVVDGASLDMSSIVAVAKFGVSAFASEKVLQGMDQSFRSMKTCLESGQPIYGVNTGFGGSADTHTAEVAKLQRNLIRFLNCGVVTPPPVKTFPQSYRSVANTAMRSNQDRIIFDRMMRNTDQMPSSIMPDSWVRAMLVVRSNSLASGRSGVRSGLVSNLIQLLNKKITPVVPLRGSISASGDLIPLSYVAATLQGSREVEVWTGEMGEFDHRPRSTAEQALSKSSLTHLRLGPKEGLSMVNGTSVSAGVACLALHDTHGLISLSQVLTAMAVEALRGSSESFHPIFSQVRPHLGQFEVSRNIRSFLKGSLLVSDKAEEYENEGTLRQDRYSIRTAPQWLGPHLEDLFLADRQITVELNSTTDNPLVDPRSAEMLHGGNFQAMSVTSAMEKTRSAIISVGRLLFAQCTEVINPALSNGLPPNLTADEPSQSFIFKGVDICMASLQSELGLLSTPVMPQVQNAEMGNQSVNSLALLSARFSHMALDVLSQMSAAYLLALCQALDLRALEHRFLSAFETALKTVTTQIFGQSLDHLTPLHQALWTAFKTGCDKTTSVDSSQRFIQIAESMRSVVLGHAHHVSHDDNEFVARLQEWTERCATLALQHFRSALISYSANPDASELLGSGSKKIYAFVRSDLNIPFETTAHEADEVNMSKPPDNRNLGALVSEIHGAIQKGSIFLPVMDCLREAELDN
ncbi:MAG: hypothetical protein Q9222_004636 [Ikaeria aurantiellina]